MTHCSLVLALFEQEAAAPLVWCFRKEWVYLGEPLCLLSRATASLSEKPEAWYYWYVLVSAWEGTRLSSRLCSIEEC